MDIRKLAGLAILIHIFIISCAGNYGIYKRKTGSEAKVIKQELVENWSDYNIRYNGKIIYMHVRQ